jgi:hypothetical protein
MAQARTIMARERGPAENRTEGRRWPVPQSLMFVTASTACLWALLFGGVYWLLW